MNIFKRLKGVKTATDYAALIPQIAADLAAAKANVGKLEGQREAALFDGGDSDLAILQSQITAAREHVSTLQIALDGAKRRHEEAAAAETSAQMELAMAEARKTHDRLRARYKKLHALFEAIAEAMPAIAADRQHVEAANQAAHEAGRSDLMIEHLESEILGEKHEAALAFFEGQQLPANIGNMPVDISFADLRIPGYWPVRSTKPYSLPPLSYLK